MLAQEVLTEGAGRVAILEDTPSWRQIADYLSRAAYLVQLARDEAALHELLATTSIDAVLLDVQSPRGSRFLCCEQVSRLYAVAVLVVGSSHDISDKIVSLEIGADDYIEAPCNLRELLARIRSVIRGRAAARRAVRSPIYRIGPWRLDIVSREVRTPDNQQVHLSPHEFSLLRAFVSAPNRMFSRHELIELVGQEPAGVTERAVDVLVSRLRKKLADPTRQMFKTVRNEGYVMTAEVERAA